MVNKKWVRIKLVPGAQIDASVSRIWMLRNMLCQLLLIGAPLKLTINDCPAGV